MKSLLLPFPSSHLSKSLSFLPHRFSAPLFVSRLRFLARPFASSPPSSPSSSSSSCRLSKSLCFCRPISMSSTAASGEIHVIVGPMFAGKTTALLRRLQAECDSGRNVAVVKSNKDTRYGIDSIVTHDGLQMPCWALPDLSSFAMKVGIEEYQKLDVIGIDEGQFFGDLYDFCCKVADYDGKTVIVAGLDGDFLRRSFGSVIDIIPLADTVTKLSARCELCGNRAHFTLRKTSDTQTELIGGSDVYMPVCRQHYVNGQVVIEAARSVIESHNIHCESAPEVSPVTV